MEPNEFAQWARGQCAEHDFARLVLACREGTESLEDILMRMREARRLVQNLYVGSVQKTLTGMPETDQLLLGRFLNHLQFDRNQHRVLKRSFLHELGENGEELSLPERLLLEEMAELHALFTRVQEYYISMEREK